MSRVYEAVVWDLGVPPVVSHATVVLCGDVWTVYEECAAHRPMRADDRRAVYCTTRSVYRTQGHRARLESRAGSAQLLPSFERRSVSARRPQSPSSHVPTSYDVQPTLHCTALHSSSITDRMEPIERPAMPLSSPLCTDRR